MSSIVVGGFYAFQALSNFGMGLFIPVEILYLLDKGFDMTDLALLILVFSLVQLVAEIPTGIVADRFSRRGSVAIGQILYSTCWVLYILGDTFTILACAFGLFGLGVAFSSGATSALVFDALKIEGRDESFQQIFGTGQSIAKVFIVVGTAAGGVISAHLGMTAVLWGSAAFCALAGLMILTIPEPTLLIEEGRQQAEATIAQAVVEYGRHLAGSVRVVHSSAALRALFAMKAIIVVPLSLAQHYYTQPYLATFKYSAAQIYYVYTFLFLVEAVLSKFSAAVRSNLNTERRTYAVITALVLIAIMAIANAPLGWVVVFGLVIARAAMGLATPTLQESLNRRLNSGQRASCLSLAAMGQSLLMALCMPLFGHIADTWSLRTSLWVLEGVFVPLLVLTWVGGRWLREPPMSTEVAE